jgi:hypothetical protein
MRFGGKTDLVVLALIGAAVVGGLTMYSSRLEGEDMVDMDAIHQRAQTGDAHAQYVLGSAYYRSGFYIAGDHKEAADWYRKAAEQGYGPAQSCLGAMYRRGQGVERSDIDAAGWYSRAAEQGIASAQFNLGLMYTRGQGVEQDPVEGCKWLTLAAGRLNIRDANQAETIRSRLSPEQLAEAQRRAREFRPKAAGDR